MATLADKGALGNYIHLNYNNYLNEGVEDLPGMSNGNNINVAPGLISAYIEAKTLIKDKIANITDFNNTELEKIKNVLDSLLVKRSSAYGDFFKSDKDEIKFINEILTEFVSQEAKHEIGEIVNGKRFTKKDFDDAKKRRENWRIEMGKIGGDVKIRTQKVKKRVKQEKRKIIDNIKKFNQSTKDVEKREAASDIEKTLKDLIKTITNLYKANKKDERKHYVVKQLKWLEAQLEEELNLMSSSDLATISNIIKQIDNMLGQLNVITTATFFQGQFGEYLTAVGLMQLKNSQSAAEISLCEALTAVKGGERTPWYFESEDIIGMDFTIRKKDGTLTGKQRQNLTQDKIDVEYEVFFENSQENKIISASVKNVATSTIELQEMRLTELLVYFERHASKYGTHFLNLLNNQDSFLSVNYLNIIKTLAAYTALAAGNPLKESKPANIFIVMNTRYKDTVSVLSTKILLNDLTNFRFSSGLKDYNKLYSILKETNKRQGNKEQRITNIMQKIHAQTITVSIKNFMY